MRLVGFCGYAGAGKSTASQALANEGWVRYSFADPVRAVVSLATGVPVEVMLDPVLKLQPHPNLYGKTPREVLQKIGTEGFREMVGPTIWVDCFRRAIAKYDDPEKAQPVGIYVDDVRFPEEVAALRELGAVILGISAAEHEVQSYSHASESHVQQLLKSSDRILCNVRGTVSTQELHKNVLEAVNNYFSK